MVCGNEGTDGAETNACVIQPFEGFPESDIQYLERRLKEDYTGAVEVRKAIPLPKSAFYPPRSRYRADTLLAFLKRRVADGERLIGLAHRDMSYAQDSMKPDFGIMGMSTMPSKACIISSRRVYKNGVKQDHLYKVELHKLGHVRGLRHCAEKTCYLRDANGGNTLHEETGFCAPCKKSMNVAGWRFPQVVSFTDLRY